MRVLVLCCCTNADVLVSVGRSGQREAANSGTAGGFLSERTEHLIRRSASTASVGAAGLSCTQSSRCPAAFLLHCRERETERASCVEWKAGCMLWHTSTLLPPQRERRSVNSSEGPQIEIPRRPLTRAVRKAWLEGDRIGPILLVVQAEVAGHAGCARNKAFLCGPRLLCRLFSAFMTCLG